MLMSFQPSCKRVAISVMMRCLSVAPEGEVEEGDDCWGLECKMGWAWGNEAIKDL